MFYSSYGWSATNMTTFYRHVGGEVEFLQRTFQIAFQSCFLCSDPVSCYVEAAVVLYANVWTVYNVFFPPLTTQNLICFCSHENTPFNGCFQSGCKLVFVGREHYSVTTPLLLSLLNVSSGKKFLWNARISVKYSQIFTQRASVLVFTWHCELLDLIPEIGPPGW